MPAYVRAYMCMYYLSLVTSAIIQVVPSFVFNTFATDGTVSFIIKLFVFSLNVHQFIGQLYTFRVVLSNQ